MIHQIVGIGDLHLRSTSSRNAARLAAFDYTIGQGLALPALAAWLHLGDVFDSRSTVEDRNALAERLLRMATRAPVVIVGGNHCAPGDLAVFGKLSARWPIHVVVTPQTLAVQLVTGRTACFSILPYPHRAGLIAAGSVASGLLQVGAQALEDICRGLAMEMADAQAAGMLTLFAAHVNVEGSRMSNGQPSIGQELSITPAMLQLFGDVPKLLGHIHLPQEIGGAHYVGSVAPSDWGEIEQKRFVVVEWDDVIGRTLLSHPIPTPAMYHVAGDVSRDAGFAWRVTKGPGGELQEPPASWTGAEVRVRYAFPASERALVDEEAIRAPFAGAARLELEPVAVPDRALRAPEVAAAVTLAEKLGAWSRLNGSVNASASVLQKLAALEHQDATAVLSAVATQVAVLEAGQKEQVAA